MSDIYKVSDFKFKKAVKESKNIHQALKQMGMNARGAAYKSFKSRCNKLNINLDHFKSEKQIRAESSNALIKKSVSKNKSRQSVLISLGLNPHINSNVKWIDSKINDSKLDTSHWTGKGYLKNKKHSWSKKLSLDEILIKDSAYTNTTSLKNRLVKEKILKYKCNECGISKWRGNNISLQLEHINGNNSDNRISNLCLLCPNCHSQTSTFAGKNKKTTCGETR